jgi:hypothetical protein
LGNPENHSSPHIEPKFPYPQSVALRLQKFPYKDGGVRKARGLINVVNENSDLSSLNIMSGAPLQLTAIVLFWRLIMPSVGTRASKTDKGKTVPSVDERERECVNKRGFINLHLPPLIIHAYAEPSEALSLPVPPAFCLPALIALFFLVYSVLFGLHRTYSRCYIPRSSFFAFLHLQK